MDNGYFHCFCHVCCFDQAAAVTALDLYRDNSYGIRVSFYYAAKDATKCVRNLGDLSVNHPNSTVVLSPNSLPTASQADRYSEP